MSGILSPQQIRERLIESYRRSYARAGRVVSTRELEAMAQSDLEITDRHNRLAAARPARSPRPRRERPDVLATAQQETGTRITEGGQFVRSRMLHGDPLKVSEQWGAAVRRIAQLTASVARAPTLTEAIHGSDSPKLVHEYTEAYAYFLTRDKPPPPGVDHNPFRGLSDKDAARAFMRRVYDICDRSTGQFGPWWVR